MNLQKEKTWWRRLTPSHQKIPAEEPARLLVVSGLHESTMLEGENGEETKKQESAPSNKKCNRTRKNNSLQRTETFPSSTAFFFIFTLAYLSSFASWV